MTIIWSAELILSQSTVNSLAVFHTMNILNLEKYEAVVQKTTNLKQRHQRGQWILIAWPSYSVSDIQDHFGYIIKNHEILSPNSPIHIYINRINNRLVSKNKTWI